MPLSSLVAGRALEEGGRRLVILCLVCLFPHPFPPPLPLPFLYSPAGVHVHRPWLSQARTAAVISEDRTHLFARASMRVPGARIPYSYALLEAPKAW